MAVLFVNILSAKFAVLTPEIFSKHANEEAAAPFIPASQQQNLMEPCRLAFALCRWRRLIMRLIGRYAWHAQSLQVWLLQQCYLWFLPFPYPSIASVEDWKFQAKTMADQLVMVPYHWQRARNNGAFTSQNLLELSKFRDRVGWKFAFMKSCILSGLMAAKASREFP